MKWKAMELLRTNEDQEVVDCFPLESNVAIDYPDVASKVAQMVSSGEADRGVLICGTGIGMCIVANKYPGVRAAVCSDELTAEISRRHNNLNILCLSGDMLGDQALQNVLHTWIVTEFEGKRHETRLEKIAQIEGENMKCSCPSN